MNHSSLLNNWWVFFHQQGTLISDEYYIEHVTHWYHFSRAHIPVAFHSLMTDEDSPIHDFYPIEFEVDMDGKKWEWQGKV